MLQQLKWSLFPGLNLHARLRNRVLPQYFGKADVGQTRRVLDAGCGNGMLAYQAYQRGNHVLGVSIKDGEIARNRELFHKFLGVPEERLQFRVFNLYDLESLEQQFDEIICTEVLEHIVKDDEVCHKFFKVLKPGGTLHLCCPNGEHPHHEAEHLDSHESGGHVRAGYTQESYRALLEPIGFRIESCIGLGGPVRQACNKRITQAQQVGGLGLGLLTFALLWPLSAWEGPNARVPYSLYVRAAKPPVPAATKHEAAEAVAVG